MSILSCGECHKPISDTASRCPHCGAGRMKAVGVRSVVGVKTIGAVIALAGFWLMAMEYDNGHSGSIASMIAIAVGLTLLFFTPMHKRTDYNPKQRRHEEPTSDSEEGITEDQALKLASRMKSHH